MKIIDRKNGVLICNLGSPKSPSAEDVKVYLKEFLSDDRVVDLAKPLQQAILNLAILPFRPKKIWGSLLHYMDRKGIPLDIAYRTG